MLSPAITEALTAGAVTKRFGGLVAVDNMSFKLAEREVLGLIGPNGSGKTTMMNLISGALKPSAGEISVYGEAVTGIGAAGMTAPLARTRQAMPDPVVVIATGADAISGGLFAGGYATGGGAAGQLDVDVWVPGSPATPFSLLHGILLALGRVPAARRGA